MTAHYETCILLIEFEEDKFGLRTREDARRESAGRNADLDRREGFELQSKLVLLALHFPRLRLIWSSSPHESVRILSDLKLNHDEPDEIAAILKGSSGGDNDTLRPSIENELAVAMLRSIPGVSGNQIRYILAKVESIKSFVELEKEEMIKILGEENGKKAWNFVHTDSRRMMGAQGMARTAGQPREGRTILPGEVF
jgi:DNA excision repair protein ERCC-4